MCLSDNLCHNPMDFFIIYETEQVFPVDGVLGLGPPTDFSPNYITTLGGSLTQAVVTFSLASNDTGS